jgi:hypothetical protein
MAEVLDGQVSDGAVSVLGRLTEASRIVDLMWLEALDDGRTADAIELGDASHGIHRAMIALAPHAGRNRQTEEFPVDWR